MPVDILGLSFAAFVALGGVIGYLKSNSTASLASGLLFGALISLSAQFAASAGASKSANIIPAALCVVLLLVMGSRFMSSKKFMPAGMVAVTSLLMAIRFAAKTL